MAYLSQTAEPTATSMAAANGLSVSARRSSLDRRCKENCWALKRAPAVNRWRKRLVADHFAQRAAERGHITRRDEQAALALDDNLFQTAHRRGDHGNATGQSFQSHEAERFDQRWNDANIHRVPELRHFRMWDGPEGIDQALALHFLNARG